jgi:hypothetical protein
MKLVFIVESENIVQDAQSFHFQRRIPDTPSWRSAQLVKHGDNFTFFFFFYLLRRNPECMYEVQLSETVSYSCNQKA